MLLDSQLAQHFQTFKDVSSLNNYPFHYQELTLNELVFLGVTFPFCGMACVGAGSSSESTFHVIS